MFKGYNYQQQIYEYNVKRFSIALRRVFFSFIFMDYLPEDKIT